MPFDTMTTAAVTDELKRHLTGGRVQKILQPGEGSIGLEVYADRQTHWLLLCADARWARVQVVSGKLARAFATPSSFVMLLRKYLDGGRVTDVEQIPGERVIVAHIDGPLGPTRLVTEVMGKHSNVILLGMEDRILGAVKNVPRSQSRVRPVLPGLVYTLPPTQGRDTVLYPSGGRMDPYVHAAQTTSLLESVPRVVPATTAISGLFAGISPFLAREIVVRAGGDGRATVGEVGARALVQAAGALYALFSTGTWQPCTFSDLRGKADFAAFLPEGVNGIEQMGSMSAAIQTVVGVRENRDVLATARREVLVAAQRAQQGVERKIASLRAGLTSAAGAEDTMLAGQMILAYQHTVKQGDTVLALPEMEMRIALDPRLKPVENAERAFRRYRKLKDAAARIPPLVAEAEKEAERLRDVVSFASIAQDEGELRALRREVERPRPAPSGKKGRKEEKRGPRRYVLDGHTVLVGRTAGENEEVTFRLARRGDLWLHARERTGAHVIVRDAPDPVPDDLLRGAAQLAAYYSDGRTDTAVDVDVTRARNVRKIPGGPPGRVTYRNFETVRVEPRLPRAAAGR